MAIRINKQDWYYGVALYAFFKYNTNVKPSIVELHDKESCCYRMTPNNGDDFYLFIKYRTTKGPSVRDKSLSWPLRFTESDKQSIEECVCKKPVYIMTVCRDSSHDDTFFSVMTYGEYKAIADLGNATLKLNRAEKQYKAAFSILKDRKELYCIERNRIENNLADIESKL